MHCSLFKKVVDNMLKAKPKLGIFGASGFSREVLDIAIDANDHSEIVFIDNEPKVKELFDFIVSDESQVDRLAINEFVFIIGVGDNKVRKAIYNKFKDIKYCNLIHLSATFGYRQKENFESGIGNIVAAGVRMTNNITIGNFCVFNLNSTIGHDCIIEDFVNFAPGVNVSGNVHICEGAYIGTNSSIIQGTDSKKIRIGRYSIVGANAVVVKDVPDFAVVKGVPAR